jgi:hypothetical protein
VILRDFSILKGGHFGILATGVDNLSVDNLKIDTDRDGIDIDCCRNDSWAVRNSFTAWRGWNGRSLPTTPA